MVRALAHRLFSKFIASLVNGWIFAGTAIAAETDLSKTGEGIVDPKIVLAIILVGAIMAFARFGVKRVTS